MLRYQEPRSRECFGLFRVFCGRRFEVARSLIRWLLWQIPGICPELFLLRRTRLTQDRVTVFDNGKCSRKITSRSAHSTCSPRANRVDIPMPDCL